jgi:6-pyruvoyltetrahydropterin/6-carboxytetrahydropterin synthase
MELRTSVIIAMAHRLQDFVGPCRNLHGHNWVIDAYCGIDPDEVNNKDGYVVEFGKLRKSIKDATDFFDHSTILETGDFLLSHLRFDKCKVWEVNVPPTTEHIASLLFEAISDMLHAEYEGRIRLNYIEVHETPNNCVVATAHSTGVKLV